jgi:hypothetical protein
VNPPNTSRSFLLAVALLTLSAPLSAQVAISDPTDSHDFGRIPLSATYATQYFSLFNSGNTPVMLGQVTVDGQLATCMALSCGTVSAGDFVVEAHSDGCSNVTLQAGQGCSTLLNFVPQAPGPRSARLVFSVQGGDAVTRIVSGTGVFNPIDCVLDWAERTYPDLLTQPTPTLTVGQFHARCYGGGTTLCVGADTALPSVAPASIYLYLNGQLSHYAALADMAASATYPAPSTRRCDQEPDRQ